MITPFLLDLAYFSAKVNAKLLTVCFLLVCSQAAQADSKALSITQITNQQLLLSNGETIELAGIMSNHAYHLPDNWLHVPITVDCPHRNRYGTSSCLVRRQSDDRLLQETLLQQGKAMLYSPYPLAVMKALQWQETIQAEPANTVIASPERWAIVEGTVKEVALRRYGAYLNFGDNWRDDFTIYLPKETLKSFAEETLQSYQGKQIRVRGWLHSYYGARITLFNPQMLELKP